MLATDSKRRATYRPSLKGERQGIDASAALMNTVRPRLASGPDISKGLFAEEEDQSKLATRRTSVFKLKDEVTNSQPSMTVSSLFEAQNWPGNRDFASACVLPAQEAFAQDVHSCALAKSFIGCSEFKPFDE